MKDRQTQRAVKNILHNELGITNEKVELLITDYINKKFDDEVKRFMNSTRFEVMVHKSIEKQIDPIIKYTLRNQLAGITINVNTKKEV